MTSGETLAVCILLFGLAAYLVVAKLDKIVELLEEIRNNQKR